MTMMKKITATILTILTVLSVLVIPASAAEKTKLAINLTSPNSNAVTINQNSSLGIHGTVTAKQGKKLTEVSGYIVKKAKVLLYAKKYEQKKTVNPNAASFKLDNSIINSGLVFNTLQPGDYYLVIKAKDTSKQSVTKKVKITVKKSDPNSTLKINVTSYPTTINEGSSFGLRGEITSNYIITKVNGWISNSNESASCTPNAKKLYIKDSNINKNLHFNNLKSGNYTLYIEAYDKSGNHIKWYINFTVKASTQDVFSTSAAGYDFIKKQESFHAKKYPDYSQYSIGYGTRWREGDPNPCTETWASNRLKEVIQGTYEPALNKFKTKYNIKLSQPMYDALISFSYNLGSGCWDNSNSFATINKMLKDGAATYTDARITEIFKLYCKAGGVVNQGLLNRRAAEANMFISGLNR